MTVAEQQRLESALLRAWPPLEEERLDGWTLRFSDGFSKRANSVQAPPGSISPLSGRVAECERWYAQRDGPCLFRLTPFSEPGLETLLADRGYARLEPTDVLCLDGISTSADAPGPLRPLRLEHWLQTYASFSNMPTGAPYALGRIIGAIPQPVLLAVLMDGAGARAVACGLAAVDDELVGLENLVAHPDARRRGHGTELVHRLVAWGASRGATRAYLLVTRSNIPAQNLYRKLGFVPAYEYWYRIREAP